jgi:hypothetical protein
MFFCTCHIYICQSNSTAYVEAYEQALRYSLVSS